VCLERGSALRGEKPEEGRRGEGPRERGGQAPPRGTIAKDTSGHYSQKKEGKSGEVPKLDGGRREGWTKGGGGPLRASYELRD